MVLLNVTILGTYRRARLYRVVFGGFELSVWNLYYDMDVRLVHHLQAQGCDIGFGLDDRGWGETLPCKRN